MWAGQEVYECSPIRDARITFPRLLVLPSRAFVECLRGLPLTSCVPSWPYIAFLACLLGFLPTSWVPSWTYVAFLVWLPGFLLPSWVTKKAPEKLVETQVSASFLGDQEGTEEVGGNPRRQEKKSTNFLGAFLALCSLLGMPSWVSANFLGAFLDLCSLLGMTSWVSANFLGDQEGTREVGGNPSFCFLLGWSRRHWRSWRKPKKAGEEVY